MPTYSLKPWLEPKRTMSLFLVIWTHSHLPVPSVFSEKVRNKVMPPVPLLLRRQPFFTESSRNAVLLSPLKSKLAPGYFWVTVCQITKLFSSKYCSSIFYNLINKQSFFQLINNDWHLLSQVPFHAVPSSRSSGPGTLKTTQVTLLQGDNGGGRSAKNAMRA